MFPALYLPQESAGVYCKLRRALAIPSLPVHDWTPSPQVDDVNTRAHWMWPLHGHFPIVASVVLTFTGDSRRNICSLWVGNSDRNAVSPKSDLVGTVSLLGFLIKHG